VRSIKAAGAPKLSTSSASTSGNSAPGRFGCSSGPIGASRHEDQPVPLDVGRLADQIKAPPVKTFAGELQADAVAGRAARDPELDRLIGDSRDWADIRTWSREIATTLDASSQG